MELKHMDNEVYSFALKSTLDEIRNVCPGIENSFMFKENGEIIARDESTPEKVIVQVVDAFDSITEKADAIGGVECMTIECNKGSVNVICIGDLHLVTVTSTKADLNHVNIVTRVLIPTVLKLLEKIHPAPLKKERALPTSEAGPELPAAEEAEEPEEPAEVSGEEPQKEEVEEPLESEPSLPEPSANQLIVEDLQGFLVPSDIVRIDSETLSEWEKLYDDRRIEEVEVETFDGKSTQCKVIPIKDWKYEGKGIIRMPEKIQVTLEIKKGELVRVKPIVK